MKYTIELTGKQIKRFKHMNKALIKMGMGFDILSLLEPIKTTNVEDTNEYQIGYKQGVSDSKAKIEQAYKNGYNKAEKDLYFDKEEVERESYTRGYNDGIKRTKEEYNRGLKDAENAIDRLMDFTVAELEKEFGTELVTDVWLENSIQDIIAITKAYEEKKKAEEIKVGDEVQFGDESNGVVISIKDHYLRIVMQNGFAMSVPDYEVKKKTGKNFSVEVEQLLSRLKECDNEIN